jgi:hypothetical protein
MALMIMILYLFDCIVDNITMCLNLN